MDFILKQIAHIECDFPSKFGVPRQSGLTNELKAKIIFEPDFRRPESLRGIEGYSHIWLLWRFSEVNKTDWSATVRPPRLGGNTRVGVFATRSPFRPNPLGLSAVKLNSLEESEKSGIILNISGADLINNTPIYDIKPYLPFADCIPDALGGFATNAAAYSLTVNFPKNLLALVPAEKRDALLSVLSQDPRPAYQNDPTREYAFDFAGLSVHFFVENGILTVSQIIPTA